MKETRNMKRSEEWAKLSLQDVLALPTLALQSNLEKIFSFSLAISQQSTGLTQCDICFYWVKKNVKRPTPLRCSPENKSFPLDKTYTQSQKSRRASLLFTVSLGNLQEHRGEGGCGPCMLRFVPEGSRATSISQTT